ncbi:hypothetical protein G6M50_38100 [Agrobacterium rhizogenes]|nr:hypothetical protein [Rhizobium rhizogenes]NTJ83603.1 hypothetical protein [Rhizobium rhizogenes]
MAVARTQTERFGAQPFNIEGPIVAGSGIPGPNFTLGSLAWGDAEAEWVYCKLVLASQTTLQPGMWLQWDKDYNANLLTTATAVVGYGAGVFAGQSINPTVTGGPAGTVTLAAGTYYIWVQRAGQAPALVSATTTAALVIAETTTTAGQANVPASATVGTKQITPVSFQTANITFTATTVNGSNVLTLISGASTASGPFIGASISGTGIPASTTVTGVTYSPNGTVQSITLNNNATANGTAITMTVTGVLEARLMWPYIAKTN